MDFDRIKYKEVNFHYKIPLFFHENYSSINQITNKLSPQTSLFQDDPIIHPTIDGFNQYNIEAFPNLEFFESNYKPENQAQNFVEIIFNIDNLSYKQAGHDRILKHCQMTITPINNRFSPNGLNHNNPFSYHDFNFIKPYYNKPHDQRSCTSSINLFKKGGRGRKTKTSLVKGQWTIEEDRLLIELVGRYGIRKWSQIAQLLNAGRIRKQCREIWNNHLKPNIKKDIWSEEEDNIVIKAHKEIGNKWSEIAKKLPGRTENSIKNHWNATKRKQFSRRKCRLKFPTPSTLLQDYISSLTPEIINAGCRKKKSKPNTESNAANKSTNFQIGSSDSSLEYRVMDEYDFSHVPDFEFDVQMFSETSIDSLIDCVSNIEPENIIT